MKKLSAVALGLIIPAAILAVWFLVTQFGSVPQGILPKPAKVVTAFAAMVKSGQLWRDLSVSFLRVAKGFGLSVLLGIPVGALLSLSGIARKLLNPLLSAIRQVPMIAWMPLAILWFGIDEGSKTALIFISAFFPVMLNTMGGISSTPKEFVEVAKLHRLNRVKTFFKVYCPHALPSIYSGLKMAMSISWMALIVAELIAGTSGIGFRMSEARMLMRSDVMVACMIVVGVIGILLDWLLSALFRLLTHWKRERENG